MQILIEDDHLTAGAWAACGYVIRKGLFLCIYSHTNSYNSVMTY